ncbi:MAG: hypothetical protein RBR82_17340 [Pseudomonas sp.]|nr:hypothetical protein [Pseudomonas sp.]
MAEFTNQTALREQVIMALAPMIPEMEKWREVWSKLDDQKKIDWLIEGKSMFLSAAGGLFMYLLPFFDSLSDEIRRGEIVLNLQDMTIRRADND